MLNHKILVVEDDAPIREMYQFKLTKGGYRVFTAENGKIGLQLAEEVKPDIILLDLRMPVMSGEQMLTSLCSQEWGATIYVVILTNISRGEAPAAMRFLAVDRYIVKAHTTPNEVLKIVNEVVNQ